MLIRTLRAFLALHRYGTVVAAAHKVHLSQAAVSVQLKNMEQELGVALFARTRRSLKFTPAAHQLVRLAEQLISTYEQMKALGDSGTVAGVLSLGVINSALTGVMPRLLRKLTLENPRLEVKIIAGISGNLVAQVDSGLLDAAVVTQPPKSFPTNLAVQHLYTEPFVLITPHDMDYVDVAATLASSAPYIAFDRSAWAGQLIDEFRSRRGVPTRPFMELNSLDAIAALVSQGLGISIVPLIRGATWHQSPTLRIVRLPHFDRTVSLVERKTQLRTPLTATLLSSFSAILTDAQVIE